MTKFVPKALLTIIISLCFSKIFSQNFLPGCYSRPDGFIQINSDSTFMFWYSVDTYRGWAKGKWEFKRKNLILRMIPIYDTLVILKDSLPYKDTLVLSMDYLSGRISKIPRSFGFEYEQTGKLLPQKLRYKKGILYVFKNNKIQKKKIKNGYYIEPFNPWYIWKPDCN